MARITYYKNSFLASVISILSSLLGMFGGLLLVIAVLDGSFGDIPAALACLAVAVCGGSLAGRISQNKVNTEWWQEQIQKQGRESQIAGSVDFCFQVYNANPNQWTLNKIEELNPAAAAQIRQSLAVKK